MWALTNINKASESSECLNFESYNFFLEGSASYESIRSSRWYINGHFRIDGHQREIEKPKNLYSIIKYLYTKYSDNFIQRISGNFVIIRLENDHFKIFSDRFGIRKFFYYQNGKSFLISDSLLFIKSVFNDKPSEANILIYSLIYHFVGGRTLFGNIYHNKPAETIEYKGKDLIFSKYWEPSNLLSCPKKYISMHSISEKMSNIIRGNLINTELTRVSLSLTGGADTRNLLAVFLANEFKPHIYTYGNPKSLDCQKARDITRDLKLSHSIHEVNMDEDIFEEYARKIILMLGGLTSIHRAHRLIAVELEKQFADIMFLGTLGGEFIKGVCEDDYIVPSLVYENWDTYSLSPEILKKYFSKKGLRYSDGKVSKVVDFLNKEPYFQGSAVERKFNTLTFITTHLHDAQDINLYSTVMDDVYTPFLDIDYLELVFSSKYVFFQKEGIKNKYVRRVENPVFAAKFLNETYKPLLKYNYSGEHRPSEVLVNKYLAAIMKVIRQKLHSKYLPNFSLGIWMENFVRKNLPMCNDYDILRETFDIDLLMNDLANKNHLKTESYWLKFTNPIMMRFIIEELNS